MPAVLQWMVKIYAPGAYLAAVVLFLRWILPRTALGASSEMTRSLLAGAIFLAVSLPLLMIYEKRTGFLRSLKNRAKINS
jgi:hypothetical protein